LLLKSTENAIPTTKNNIKPAFDKGLTKPKEILMETVPIESDQLRAERLLIELCPDNSELKKITKGGRSQERIKMLRQVIQRLVLEGIPTAVIAKTLKMGQAVVQYHARWLEKNGKIVKPSRFAHWIDARGVE